MINDVIQTLTIVNCYTSTMFEVVNCEKLTNQTSFATQKTRNTPHLVASQVKRQMKSSTILLL